LISGNLHSPLWHSDAVLGRGDHPINVEDRLVEEMHKKLAIVQGSYLGDFILKKLHTDLKSFHNPSSDKTKRIFQDYLGFDVTEGWRWSNYEPEKARCTLNQWIKKRGDAAHRSKPISTGIPSAHLIKRDELEKVIRFIKDLVKATDNYVNEKIDQHHASVFERQHQLSS
ncbi:HEPN domain-containing protein, partial [Aeromonas enteropelogenes]|uniref:HEPN domain-containing protein n=1 Tax=Aeromonas enteropelogenes TaxID=29489 RepID=UPI003B9FC7BB